MTNETIHLYRASFVEVQALRELCKQWESEKGFWSFDTTIDILARRDTFLFYGAGTPQDDTWDGAALIKASPYATELLYLYVRPEKRRHGIGNLLMQNLFKELETSIKTEALFLEVRPSNTSARSLYERLGLVEVNLRRSYYSDGEDAIVMKRDFPGTLADEGIR